MIPKLRKHIINQSPVLDRNDVFLFFANRKVAQTSIQRDALAHRCLVRKDNPKKWKRKIRTYSNADLDTIFKFTIVRNPWDRLVSAYEYLKKTRKGKSIKLVDWSFSQFITDILIPYGPEYDRHLWHQYKNAYYKSNLFVDFVARFESINKDWEVIRRHVKSDIITLPKKNVGNHDYYTSYYTSSEVDIVAKIYRKDIHLFGYQFDN